MRSLLHGVSASVNLVFDKPDMRPAMAWKKLSAKQKETELARKRRVYRDNPEQRLKSKKRATRWFQENHEYALEVMAAARDRQPRNEKLWFTAKRRARENQTEFTISKQDVVVPDRCPVFDIPFLLTGGNGVQPNLPSLDRIDSQKRYVPGNVMVISHRANSLKSNATFEEIEALYKHMLRLRNSGVCFDEGTART
jgi:hypothetical protein